MKPHYKVVIVGAGPAGCMASLVLSSQKIEHLIIDKYDFPREKVCGDAQTVSGFTYLEQYIPNFYQKIVSNTDFVKKVDGISCVFENQSRITMWVEHPIKKDKIIVSKRQFIDNEIFKEIKSDFADINTKTRLAKIERDTHKVTLHLNHESKNTIVTADVVIAADGERSIIGRSLGKMKKDNYGYAYSIRCYYQGVEPYQDDNYLEIFEVKQIKPAYFWIFPLPNQIYNVGFGIDASHPLTKDEDLRTFFFNTLESHPSLQERFANAKRVSKLMGWGIPFGTKKNKLYGDRFMLTGDAAQLANPVTGEGFSQALCSGKYAALTAINAIEKNDFSEKMFIQYQKIMTKKVFNINNIHEKVLSIIDNTFIGRRIINKIANSETLQDELRKISTNIPSNKAKILYKLVTAMF